MTYKYKRHHRYSETDLSGFFDVALMMDEDLSSSGTFQSAASSEEWTSPTTSCTSSNTGEELDECSTIIITTTPKLKKNVSFGNLEELAFPVVQGDPNHFDVPYPMTLSWDCVARKTSPSIEAYEETQKRRRKQKRNAREMRIALDDRIKRIQKGQKTLERHHQKKVRQQLKRSNSMANGMIGRDKRRNRVQDFLGRFYNSKPSVSSSTNISPTN